MRRWLAMALIGTLRDALVGCLLLIVFLQSLAGLIGCPLIMQLDDYDGASAIAAAWADGLRPDPSLTVSAWADRHRVLSPRGANEAGP